MKFNDVAKRVLDEYLIRSRPRQSFHAPMPDAEPFQFLSRFFDVLYGEGDVRKRRILFIAPGDG